MGEIRLTRRGTLLRLGGLLGGALGFGAWRALGAEGGTGPAGVASGEISCVLAPEQSEGPFYVGGGRLRRDIRAGRPGTRLTLRLKVVDASTCKPVSGAAVDIWHCDAGGTYSGVQGRSTRFLRGVQRTNAQGLAVFETIYPGWYPGRAVHVHVKVFLGGSVVHTGQLYFPERTTDAVHRRAPYSFRGSRDTRNAADAIFRNGGSRSLLRLSRTKAGYAGAITMGVQR